MPTPLCQLCGLRQATYVCQSCGRTACTNCFNPEQWTCTGCFAKNDAPLRRENADSKMPMVTLLFSVAFAMIMIGMLLITAGSTSGSNSGVSGGAVILIGPIPIILGTGPYSFEMIVLAAVLTVLALGFFLLIRRKVRP
jgi:uncharacterized membrane protein